MHIVFNSWFSILKYFSFMTCFLFVSQKRDFTEETDSVLSTVGGLLDNHAKSGDNTDTSLQVRSTHKLSWMHFTFSCSAYLLHFNKLKKSCVFTVHCLCIWVDFRLKRAVFILFFFMKLCNVISIFLSLHLLYSFSIYHCISALSLLPTHYLSSRDLSLI